MPAAAIGPVIFKQVLASTSSTLLSIQPLSLRRAAKPNPVCLQLCNAIVILCKTVTLHPSPFFLQCGAKPVAAS